MEIVKERDFLVWGCTYPDGNLGVSINEVFPERRRSMRVLAASAMLNKTAKDSRGTAIRVTNEGDVLIAHYSLEEIAAGKALFAKEDAAKYPQEGKDRSFLIFATNKDGIIATSAWEENANKQHSLIQLHANAINFGAGAADDCLIISVFRNGEVGLEVGQLGNFKENKNGGRK